MSGPALEVRDVRADYGGHVALDGVSAQVASGEILLVAGHNGAGKSTLLKACMGMVPLRGGEVLLGGEAVTRLPTDARLDRGIALVPQGRGSFPNLTVLENLRLAGLRGTSTRLPLEERLEKVRGRFPVLGQMSGRLAGRLSGGQQQMLAIGMALMKEPSVLLLDEPSIGLAPRVVEEIFELVLSVRQERGTTTVLVEQNLGQAARICDRVVILNAGRLAAALKPSELTEAVLWKAF
jgi:ABC-type branched-subunit amino acid transport system ATPase component